MFIGVLATQRNSKQFDQVSGDLITFSEEIWKISKLRKQWKADLRLPNHHKINKNIRSIIKTEETHNILVAGEEGINKQLE